MSRDASSALRHAVAGLASLGNDDIKAILDGLTPPERRRAEALLRDFAGLDSTPYDATNEMLTRASDWTAARALAGQPIAERNKQLGQLSSAQRQRLQGLIQVTRLTPTAHQTLLDLMMSRQTRTRGTAAAVGASETEQ